MQWKTKLTNSALHYNPVDIFPSMLLFYLIVLGIIDTNAALSLFRGQSKAAREAIFCYTHKHTHAHITNTWEINPSDSKSINTAWKVGSKLFQVGPWSLSWPWQDVGMQAGMTHSLMCYHGNREEQGSCACVWIVKRSCLFIINHFWGFKKKMFFFIFIFSIDP